MKLNRLGRVVMMEHHLNCWLEAQQICRKMRMGRNTVLWWHVAQVHEMYGRPLMSTAPENCQ